MPWGHKRGREVSLKVEREVVTMKFEPGIMHGIISRGTSICKEARCMEGDEAGSGNCRKFFLFFFLFLFKDTNCT